MTKLGKPLIWDNCSEGEKMEDEHTQRQSNGHTSVLFTCVKRFTRPEKRKRTIRSLIEERPQKW